MPEQPFRRSDIWYAPQVLDRGSIHPVAVALAPVFTEVEGLIDLVLAVGRNHDANAINEYAGLVS